MQVSADVLGEYLRQEREQRHVSLQDISAATKVQLKFLAALEEDDYDHLPPAPFVVGFLRAYAQCLRLNPEEIIAAYHARYGSSTNPAGYRLPVAYRVKRSRHVRWKGLGIAVMVVILVGGVAWHRLWRHQEQSTISASSRPLAEQTRDDFQLDAQTGPLTVDLSRPQLVESTSVSLPESTAPPTASKPSEAAIVTAEPTVPEPSEAVLSASPVADLSPAPLRTPLVLQAVALEDTWLRVDIDADTRHSLLLAAGKSVEWEAAERFVLRIGNAHGTRLTLNGREVPLPPTQDNVIRDFVVTRDRVN